MAEFAVCEMRNEKRFAVLTNLFGLTRKMICSFQFTNQILFFASRFFEKIKVGGKDPTNNYLSFETKNQVF